MSPVEVAKYVRCFQKAATTKQVKSRLIRRDGSYNDSVAELIRALLPKDLFRLLRRSRHYDLVCQIAGHNFEAAQRLVERLPAGTDSLRAVAQRNAVGYRGSRSIDPPYDRLLDEAILAHPVLARFRRDEAKRAAGEVVEEPAVREAATVTPQPQPAEAPEEDEHFDEPFEEEEEPAVVNVTPAVPPAVVADGIAAAMRAREERMPTNVEFRSEAQRLFAEAVARAQRGRR